MGLNATQLCADVTVTQVQTPLKRALSLAVLGAAINTKYNIASTVIMDCRQM